MIECLIIGDSIAKGIATHRPDCVSYSKVGINSAQWNRKYYNLNVSAVNTIISLGTNDKGIQTELELRGTRAIIKSERVYWILPQNVEAQRKKQINPPTLWVGHEAFRLTADP